MSLVQNNTVPLPRFIYQLLQPAELFPLSFDCQGHTWDAKSHLVVDIASIILLYQLHPHLQSASISSVVSCVCKLSRT